MASPRQAGTAYPVRRALMVLVSAFGHDANTVIVYCCVVKSGDRGRGAGVRGRGVVVFGSQFLVFSERRWRAVVCREERRLQHLLATEGHGGTRRTATATDTPFCPRRATKGHEERQLQHLLATEGHGGTRRTATATAKPFCPRRATEGHGELQLQHLLSAENCGE